MIVLGITDGITCGATVVRDGSILAAVNEERLSRLKMAYGFPRASIREVLELSAVKPLDVDLVMVDTVNNFFSNGVKAYAGWLEQDRGKVRNSIFALAGALSGFMGVLPPLEKLYYASRYPIFRKRRNSITRIVRDEFEITSPVEFANHHLAHAASAYFTSGFDDAVVVTMDGGGDGESSHIYEVRDGAFKLVTSTSAFNSLANYYAYVTQICGYKAQKHEGKITGLAAHGEPIYRQILDEMVTFRNGRIVNVSGRVFRGAIREIERRLPKAWRKEDLAASIQQHCENLARQYIQFHLTADSPRNLAVAGGLFANVRINQRVFELDQVDRLFVHPGMTDCGLAVGAALVPCIRNRQTAWMNCDREVQNVYLGRSYTTNEIESQLRASELKYHRPKHLEIEVAKLLADGYVVARFDGRMEYGPRALGNRSILYQPADATVNEWLNDSLHRTEFMPFAPATTWEDAGRFYLDFDGAADAARFMTITFECSEWMRKYCPGVVHIDGTARPQLVREDDNPSFYQIIKEFAKITGVPTIINTSFNMHEEPIVCSPTDAIRAFLQGHLDYLAIGGFLVPSQTPPRHQLIPMRRLSGKTHAAHDSSLGACDR